VYFRGGPADGGSTRVADDISFCDVEYDSGAVHRYIRVYKYNVFLHEGIKSDDESGER